LSRRYRLVEHTADLAIRLYASTICELFVCAAEAMFQQLVGKGTVPAVSSVSVCVEGTDYESLLVNWLNELLYLHETRREAYSNFSITTLSPEGLNAIAMCAPFTEARMLIKAATYHGLSVTPTRSGYKATVLFDV
jgi:SHS2 domain-containing protein